MRAPRRSGKRTACGLAARPTVAKTEYPRRAATGSAAFPGGYWRVFSLAIGRLPGSGPSTRTVGPKGTTGQGERHYRGLRVGGHAGS